MFSNKFNPDIISSFDTINKKRNKDKLKPKNIPYKNITSNTNENENIKSSKDLLLDINENKIDYDLEYEKMVKDRNIKINKKIEIKNDHFKDEIMNLYNKNEHNDLKLEFESKFKKEEEDLKNIKSNYNSIMESLLNEGLLD